MSIEQPTLMTVEDLDGFVDTLLPLFKKELEDSGEFVRRAYLFTAKMPGPEQIKMGKFELIAANPKPTGETEIVMLDLSGDAKNVMGAIANAYPKVYEIIPSIAQVGKELALLDEGKIAFHFVRAFLRATQLDLNDVLGDYLAVMVKKLEAYAYIHVSEVWVGESKPVDQAPDRKSAINIVIESKTIQKYTTILYDREKNEAGKDIVVWKDPVTVQAGKDADVLTGRLLGILYDQKSVS